MTVTREVVADLWPLYVSGDVSPDTRALVEAFLATDPEFARTLRTAADGPLALPAPPPLPADHEMKVLHRVKRRLRGPIGLLQMALVFSCVAFGRIVSDTTWTASPRNFIVAATIAAGFWIAFFVGLIRGQRSVLVSR